MEKRKCENCEYYFKVVSYLPGKCFFNPPQVSGEDQNGRFPNTSADDFCSKWEPKWHDNPMIQEAWEQFVMAHKIITSGEEQS